MESRRNKRWLLWAVLLLVLGALVLGGIGFSRWANHVTIPAELRKIPAKYDINPAPVIRVVRSNPLRTVADSAAPNSEPNPYFTAIQALQNTPPSDPYKQLFDQLGRDKTLGSFLEQFLNEKDPNGMNHTGRLRPFWRNYRETAAVDGAYRRKLFAWIDAHRQIYAQLYALIDRWAGERRSPAPAQGGRQFFEAQLTSGRDELFMIVLADGRKQLTEGNDAGVEQAGRALLQIVEVRLVQLKADNSGLSQIFLANTIDLLWTWIDSRRLEPARAARMKAALDQAAPILFSREQITKMLKTEYQDQRRWFIDVIDNRPWNSPLYGWDTIRQYQTYYMDVYILGKSVMVPRPGPMLGAALKAIRVKKSAPALLAALDQAWQAEIENSGQEYAELFHQDPKVPSEDQAAMLLLYFPRHHQTLVRWLLRATRWNLMRAALDLQLNPQAAAQAQAVDFRPQPGNCWRDPFTGKSLRLIIDKKMPPAADKRLYSSGRIYSPGPDLRDHQQGAYDNGPANDEFFLFDPTFKYSAYTGIAIHAH